jgi:hypothetical protein
MGCKANDRQGAQMRLVLPTFVMIPRKTKEDKKVFINLNTYRNLHHMTNNQAKQIFKEELRFDLPFAGAMPSPPLRLTYTLYQATGRATDVANVCCVADKYASDGLVELGVISDDNHKIISEVVYRYGGVDRENPRVELLIESIGVGDGKAQ